jgi:hypothetical protein
MYKHEEYLRHRDDYIRRAKKWQKKNPEKCKYNSNKRRAYMKDYMDSYYKDNKEKVLSLVKQSSKKRGMEIKLQVLTHYSNGRPKCACCGEMILKFLTIDHINNDGQEERKRLKLNGGMKFYRWLIKNNYPESYQVLCMNCNWGKSQNNGVCPHKDDKTIRNLYKQESPK